MTTIIRLNEAINDYVSRPVITLLGEPLIAINVDTYKDQLGGLATINPSDVLIDGSYGQSKPNPFITKTGKGSASVKTDNNGSYISFNNCGFRSSLDDALFEYDKSQSLLFMTKFRVNKLDSSAKVDQVVRVFSIHQNGPLFAISIVSRGNGTYLSIGMSGETPITTLELGKIYTIALLRSNSGCKVFVNGTVINDGMPNVVGDANSPKEIIRAVGLNTRSIDFGDEPNHSVDLFNYALYGNGSWTEAKIANYLKNY